MTTATAPERRTQHIDSARSQAESIEAAYLAMEWLNTDEDDRDGNDLSTGARALLRELSWDGTNVDDVTEAITERMDEEPLSVEVGGWWNPGDETPEPSEFRILLSTGGPACRLVGPIDCDGCTLEAQDWFIPWQPVTITSTQQDALDWFAGLLLGGLV